MKPFEAILAYLGLYFVVGGAALGWLTASIGVDGRYPAAMATVLLVVFASKVVEVVWTVRSGKR